MLSKMQSKEMYKQFWLSGSEFNIVCIENDYRKPGTVKDIINAKSTGGEILVSMRKPAMKMGSLRYRDSVDVSSYDVLPLSGSQKDVVHIWTTVTLERQHRKRVKIIPTCYDTFLKKMTKDQPPAYQEQGEKKTKCQGEAIKRAECQKVRHAHKCPHQVGKTAEDRHEYEDSIAFEVVGSTVKCQKALGVSTGNLSSDVTLHSCTPGIKNTDTKEKDMANTVLPSGSRESCITKTENLNIFPENKESFRCDAVSISPSKRYHLRTGSRKSYIEESAMEDDEYLYCDECLEDREGDCPLHPLSLVLDTPVPRDGSVQDRAEQTAPWPLSIRESKIKVAGRGVWTNEDLPPGLLFGPYEGHFLAHVEEGKESGYGWKIRRKGLLGACIDALDKSISNWMRFVNCSRNEPETNLAAFQYKGQIYYKTIKDIQRGSELMVWYGEEYGSELGLSMMDANWKTPSKEFN
ncbi:putative histone-lysine N-methyltransferase prdm7, partial [Halocaridina rubra]